MTGASGVPLQERVEDIEWCLNTGDTHLEAIARRLGVSPASIYTYLRRAGRLDLAGRITASKPRAA